MDRRTTIWLIVAFSAFGSASLAMGLLGSRSSCEHICAKKNQKAIFLGIANVRLGAGMPVCRCVAPDVGNKAKS
jgi:hypothetical protein